MTETDFLIQHQQIGLCQLLNQPGEAAVAMGDAGPDSTLERLLRWLRHQVNESAVDVRLGCVVNSEQLRRMAVFDEFDAELVEDGSEVLAHLDHRHLGAGVSDRDLHGLDFRG